MSVLVLSNAGDETVDYLCLRMAEARIDHIRLNTERIASVCSVQASSDGISLTVGDRLLRVQEVHTVWYRRPKRVEMGGDDAQPENQFAAAEWTAALEGFLGQVPTQRWLNHPASIMRASSKLEQLARAARHGLNVPPWCCTTNRDEARAFQHAQSGKLVAKPLYSGYLERGAPDCDTVIFTSRVGPDDLSATAQHLGAPTLFQREVVGGVDVRVTVVDADVTAMKLSRSGEQVDIRRNNMSDVKYERIALPVELRRDLVELVRSYDLRFAAIDLMLVGDQWFFLEINPNGQWAWLDIAGDAEIFGHFLRAFASAA